MPDQDIVHACGSLYAEALKVSSAVKCMLSLDGYHAP